ncbi:hypothetical protein [Roseicyclus marinus]|uniref:hypothetical protein n=1 Tax=Roseicyclus marinus TaxID=2161673 RepID=UPI00240FEA89|nr:hypothetical protein [Roseicyclus marinus]MDG3042503.1 hypothetical protein [Roseicyclus marinus]
MGLGEVATVAFTINTYRALDARGAVEDPVPRMVLETSKGLQTTLRVVACHCSPRARNEQLARLAMSIS